MRGLVFWMITNHPHSLIDMNFWLKMSSVKIVKECLLPENVQVLSLNYSNTKAIRFRRIIFSICLGNLIFNNLFRENICEGFFNQICFFSGLLGFLTTLSS